MSGPVGCLIYRRVSREHQAREGTSLDTQLASCQRYAAQRGWRVIDVYTDEVSGGTLDRDGLTRLRERLAQGDIGVVLAHALDRLSRSQVHVALLDEEFTRRGCQMAFVTEDFENTSVGRFLRGTKAFVAELEREKIRERTMRGQRARVESGKLLGGNKPLYGYRFVEEYRTDGRPLNARYEPNVDTAPVVRRIFAEAHRGTPLRRIALDLSSDGIPTPSGKNSRWSHQTIRTILTNPSYKGEAYGLVWRTVGSSKTIRFDVENAVALPEGTIPALVDPGLFDRTQEVLQRNKDRSRIQTQNPEEVLLRGGFIRCGVCGRAMILNKRRDGVRQYHCSRVSCEVNKCPGPSPTIVAGKIEPVVWSCVEEILRRPEVIRVEVERLRANDPTAQELAEVEKRLAEVQRRRRNLLAQIEDLEDDEDRAEVGVRLKELAERRRGLQEEQDGLLSRQRIWHDTGNRLADIERWCRHEAERLDHLSFEEKRQKLDELGVKAFVYPQKSIWRYVVTADIPHGDNWQFEAGPDAALLAEKPRSFLRSRGLSTPGAITSRTVLRGTSWRSCWHVPGYRRTTRSRSAAARIKNSG